MSEMKPTQGEWTAEPIDGNCCEVMCDSGYYIATCHDGVRSESNAIANARLIAEAGTVHHETGLTPRQLVERVKELEELLNGVLLMGRGTSGRIIVEGWQEEVLRAALSKALPNAAAKEAGNVEVAAK